MSAMANRTMRVATTSQTTNIWFESSITTSIEFKP